MRAFLADVYRAAGEEPPELSDEEIQQALAGHLEEGAKVERCVHDVKGQGSAANPWAVCHASLGECSEADCQCAKCQTKRDAQTLLEEAGFLSVPDERQQTGFACGAACVVAVCRFFSVEPDRQGDAIRQLGTSPRDGTDPEHVVTVLQDHGLETVALSGMDLETVQYFLGRGQPVIVCMQAWGTPEEVAALESGHYTVIIGVDLESIAVMDPARFSPDELVGYGTSLGGQKVSIPRERFLAGWKDRDAEGNEYRQYGIAVRGPA